MHWIDHAFLPDINGSVERFIINRHGEIDGLVLTYEPDRFLLVHLPPHLEPEINSSVTPGDRVRVRGIRPRGADMIAAVAVIAHDGQLILDNGPDYEATPKPTHEKTKRIEVAGVVRTSLFGPKGELRGALLENGDMIRVGPKEAAHVAELLRPGSRLAARGEGLELAHGRVVCSTETGPDIARLRPVKEAKLEPKPRTMPGAPDQPLAIDTE
jgi:hypothetical protein